MTTIFSGGVLLWYCTSRAPRSRQEVKAPRDFNNLVEVKDEEENQEKVFYMITPGQPVPNGRNQSHHHREVKFVPSFVVGNLEQVFLK
jgi:hypothetical protein